MLAIAVTPALATTGYRYVGQFGSPGAGEGQFSEPAGVAVQQSTGDVYVADQGNGRVEKLTAAGEPILSFDGSETPAGSFSPGSVAVSTSTGDVYVTDVANNAVDVFSSAGSYLSQLDAAATPAGGFNFPAGLAVDPSSGDVYVADAGDAAVDVFSAAGAYLTQFGAGTLFFPTSVAVDGASNVYVNEEGTLYEYPALGAGEPTVLDASNVQTVGVDPESNDVFVGESGPVGYQVADYSSTGTRLYTFGAGRIGQSAGIAVNASKHEVLVADEANNDILQYGTFVAPTVTTGGATGETAESASVTGTVNPEGKHTSYRFEYGTEPSYGNNSTEAEAGSGTSNVPVSALLEGLQPNTTYHYRLQASNTLGNNTGEDQTFTTAAAPPTVDGQTPFATNLTATGATLHATINPRNSPTTYHFNYGTSTAYGNTAPSPDAQGGSGGEEPVEVSITGLEPSTTYHFQIIANNGTGGPIEGEDQTFTTPPPPPFASTGSATSITESSAVLSGTADTLGLTGTYQFQVTGSDTPGGGATEPQPLNAINGTVAVSGTITGLAPGAHYTYRLAITTAGGTVYGESQPLATAPAPAYELPTGSATTGPVSSGLPTPGALLSTFPAPVIETPKPTTHPPAKPKCPKGKVRNKHHKCVKAPQKHSKKANVNKKGNR